MPTSNVPTTFLLLVEIFVWLLVQYGGSEAAPEHLYEFCGVDLGNTTEFAPNSTYQINLSQALSTLSAEADVNGGFRIYTARGNGDEVYGLSLCRGDVSADVCQECVGTASVDIVRNCRRVKSAIIWYDKCMLRHSNESFYSTMDTSPSVRMWNTGNVSDAYRFRRLLHDTARDVKSRAKKFATEERNFTALETLYALAQCTPDITPADCDKCLSTAIAQLPDYGSQGGRVLTPSCNIRYELYPFYNQAAVNAEAPPPLPPAPVLRRGAPPRSPGSVAPTPREKKTISSTTVIVIVVPIAVCVVLLFIGFGFLRRRAKKKYQAVEEETFRNEITTAESLEFDFGTIEAATDNFSTNNRIGRGGFGTVYKGILSNGQEIGVKRLSRSSGQGAEEFKNEVVLVAKLQHKNLIKLLGFCLKGEEKILIYEFAANKSLDYFLFDPTQQGELDWSKRYKIIGGILRGMLYLHEDSRLKIIHRDLKASNILLDGDMNPKISDFGLARLLSMNQTEENTNRIVGTYGYMSPEYAMHGHFSVKSDVFSFGVLVMEIVSGKKNRNFYHSNGVEDLLSHAWQLWRDGTPIELMDPALGETYTRNEALRCIHISLLCVQDSEAERPTMATVVHLLNSDSPSLPVPKQPAFFARSSTESNFRAKELELGHCSVNEVSITDLGPR